MTYPGRLPKYAMYIMIVSVLFFHQNIFLQFMITFIAIIMILLQLELRISSNKLEYNINLFKLTIYRRTLTRFDIKAIKFGRIGWSTKNAVIKVYGGFNIGVAHFYSEQLIDELEEFALANHIEVQKTSDYLLLEKHYTNS
ncbi:hypothetical protein [Mesobacillus thioparans]|uniref:hypothetical protein n=1 Tax=Mesobacillus thioparans TaxID=370439 RepID=UPI0039EF7B41